MRIDTSTWILLSVLSAVFLGFYDIAKKKAVKENAVPPVLLLNVLTAAVLWIPFIVYSHFAATDSNPSQLTSLTSHQHLLLMFKSLLVGTSWTLAFFALQRLPLSIATPIRATGPLWTILFAVTWMSERPSWVQWSGVAVILAAFFFFSRVGKREGIHFHRDRWVGLMIAATLLGSISALYDKYLLQSVDLLPTAVQAWFSIYLVLVMLPLAIRWYFVDRQKQPFQWRWSIPLIAIFLLVADFAYFTAVAEPDALISVISPVRRSSVVISFLYGIFNLKERNWKTKAVCILGILMGVALLSR